jgi:hypothetical protein
MNVIRPFVSVVTAFAFLVQTTGLAYALPPQDVQPVPYAPSQPVPLPSSPPSPAGLPSAPPAPPTAVPAPPRYMPAPPPPGYATAPAPGYLPGSGAVRSGGDTVYLKDGGMMRGTLVELLPNDHVTVQLPSGQSTVVEWARIDHIERASLNVAPPMPSAPPRGRAGRRMEGASPTAFVHIEADADVLLQSISPGSGRWTTVCAAPCDAALPLDHEYRLIGEGIRSSRAFGLSANPGQHVLIHVSTGSKAGFAGGLAMASIGVAAVAVGLVVLAFGALGCESTDEFGNCIGSSDSSTETVGGVIALVGVAVMVGGIILLATNARTHETQSVGALLETPARPETAWLRAPIWHDSVRDSSAAPKGMGFPLLSRSF